MLKLLQTHQSGPNHNLEFPSNQIFFPHKAPSICGSLLRYLPNLTKTIALSLGPCDSLAEVTHKSRGIKLSICQSPKSIQLSWAFIASQCGTFTSKVHIYVCMYIWKCPRQIPFSVVLAVGCIFYSFLMMRIKSTKSFTQIKSELGHKITNLTPAETGGGSIISAAPKAKHLSGVQMFSWFVVSSSRFSPFPFITLPATHVCFSCYFSQSLSMFM